MDREHRLFALVREEREARADVQLEMIRKVLEVWRDRDTAREAGEQRTRIGEEG